MTNYFGLCYSKIPSNYKTPMVLGFTGTYCLPMGFLGISVMEAHGSQADGPGLLLGISSLGSQELQG